MGRFVKGDVVILPFPFSDLSGSKRRPAFVLADLPGDDIILCQITSKAKSDAFAIPITNADFISGTLPLDSFVRPNKIFTADKNIIISTAGQISKSKTARIIARLISIIKTGKVEKFFFCRY
jgi:mRNA interferase MazF